MEVGLGDGTTRTEVRNEKHALFLVDRQVLWSLSSLLEWRGSGRRLA